MFMINAFDFVIYLIIALLLKLLLSLMICYKRYEIPFGKVLNVTRCLIFALHNFFLSA